MDAEYAEIEDRVSPPRLLLCDDSTVERMALAHFLRKQGYRVAEAEDGRSTIEHLKNGEFDAVLLDLSMPGVDGFDVLGYLQEHRRGLPVVLLTGMPVDQIQHKMQRLPTHELPMMMLKPIDPDQLVHLLELKLSGEIPEIRNAADFDTPAGNR